MSCCPELLQVLLVFPPDSKQYNEAYQQFIGKQNDPAYISTIEKALTELFKKPYKLKFDKTLAESLPNLFKKEINSFEYLSLIDYLGVLAEQEKFILKVYEFLVQLLDYKDKLDNYKHPEITLHAVLLLLLWHYGRQGTKIQRALKDKYDRSQKNDVTKSNVELWTQQFNKVQNQIKHMLSSDEPYPINYLTGELASLILVLKYFINIRGVPHLRLQARNITELLNLPLELHQMLVLTVDDLRSKRHLSNEDKKEKEDKENTEDGINVVVGTTGCGKSTLINYLTGTQYEFHATRSNTGLLLPKAGEKPRAKVGHGKNSQTLYPEVIDKFCDCPGFKDNRAGDAQICASLGIPLAIKHLGLIRSIIVVIEWKSFEVSRGEIFGSLNQTLSQLIKDPMSLIAQAENGKSPLIFVFTKPERDLEEPDKFNINKQKGFLSVCIDELYHFAHSDETTLQLSSWEADLKILREQKEDYDLAIEEVQATASLRSYDAGASIATSSIIMKVVVQLMMGARVDTSLVSIEVTRLIQELSSKGIRKGTVNLLHPFFHEILQTDKSKRESEINIYVKKWIEAKQLKEREIEKIEAEINAKIGSRVISELMKKSKENTFIIRGFKGKPHDDEDERSALLSYIASLKSQKVHISEQQLVFNPMDNQFSKVRDWAVNFAGQISPLINGLIHIPDSIRSTQKSIERVLGEIQAEKLKLKNFTSPKHDEKSMDLLISKSEEIKRQQEKLTKLVEDLTQQQDKLNKLDSEIERIQNADPVEHQCKYIFDERSAPGKFFGWQSKEKYQFEGSYYRDDPSFLERLFKNPPRNYIPIQRVECSCVVEPGTNKLVFKTSLEHSPFRRVAVQKNVRLAKIYAESPIEYVVSSAEFTSTGGIIPRHFNLEKGQLEIQYVSDNGVNGIAGIRVFVFPKYLPEFNRKIRDINARLKIERETKSKLENEIQTTAKRIEDNKNRLRILENLKDNVNAIVQQDMMVKEIIETIEQLDFNEEQFVDFCFPYAKELIEWVANSANIKDLEELLKCSETQFSSFDLSFEKNTFNSFLGIVSEVKVSKQPDLQFENIVLKVTKDRFKQLSNLSKNSGLPIIIIHKVMVNKFKNPSKAEKKNSLKDQLNIFERDSLGYQLCYHDLLKIYSQFVLQIRALDEVIKLFNSSLSSMAIIGYNELRDKFNGKIEAEYLGKRYLSTDTPEFRKSLNKDKLLVEWLKLLRIGYGCQEILKINIDKINAFEESYEGNNIFNVLSLGLRKIIEDNKLEERSYQLLTRKLGVNTENYQGIMTWLNGVSFAQYQKIMSTVIRKMSIEYIETNYAHCKSRYSAALTEALERYLWENKNREQYDQVFINHSQIKEKFDQYKHKLYPGDTKLEDSKQLRDKIENDKTLITYWWENEGKTIYFEALKKSAFQAGEAQYWGGEIEIGAFANIMGINIKIGRKIVGPGFGVFPEPKSEVEHANVALLVNLNIIAKGSRSIRSPKEKVETILALKKKFEGLPKEDQEILKGIVDQQEKKKAEKDQDKTSPREGKQKKGLNRIYFKILEMAGNFSMLFELGLVDRQSRLTDLKKLISFLLPLPGGLEKQIWDAYREPAFPILNIEFVNGVWKISEKSVVTQEETNSLPPPDAPLTMSGPGMVWKTKGEGDCAFHAALGKWDNEQKEVICHDYLKKRQEMAQAIRNADKDSPIFPLIVGAIQAQLMGGEKGFDELRRLFEQHSRDNIKTSQEAWTRFENELNNYKEIIEYINSNTENKKQLSELKQKFHYCLNLDGTLYSLIWSVDVLKSHFETYNIESRRGFNLSEKIEEDMSKDNKVLKEYAAYIARDHQWLLPLELNMIALVFDIRILFYSYNPAKSIYSAVHEFNSSGKPTVVVRFNGAGHFERIVANPILFNKSDSDTKGVAENINIAYVGTPLGGQQPLKLEDVRIDVKPRTMTETGLLTQFFNKMSGVQKADLTITEDNTGRERQNTL